MVEFKDDINLANPYWQLESGIHNVLRYKQVRRQYFAGEIRR